MDVNQTKFVQSGVKLELSLEQHGSAVFTRGQTQILSVATLAGPAMKQELDGVDPETEKTYMHKIYLPWLLSW